MVWTAEFVSFAVVRFLFSFSFFVPVSVLESSSIFFLQFQTWGISVFMWVLLVICLSCHAYKTTNYVSCEVNLHLVFSFRRFARWGVAMPLLHLVSFGVFLWPRLSFHYRFLRPIFWCAVFCLTMAPRFLNTNPPTYSVSRPPRSTCSDENWRRCTENIF